MTRLNFVVNWIDIDSMQKSTAQGTEREHLRLSSSGTVKVGWQFGSTLRAQIQPFRCVVETDPVFFQKSAPSFEITAS
jgi:hypothetical protein